MLRILVIEDNEADFLLLQRHLRQGGLVADCLRVDGAADFLAALERGPWDLVISDYNVPGVDFGETLARIQSRLPHLPVLLVSGSIGEERAVELLRQGVWDFLLKDHLARLVPAVERALRDAEDRAARARAERALRDSEARYRQMIQAAGEGIWSLNDDLNTDFVNQVMAAMLGYSLDDMLGRPVTDFVFPEDVAATRMRMAERRQGIGERSERRFRRKDGSECWCFVSAAPHLDEGGNFLGSLAMCMDVTRRRQEEVALKRYAQIVETSGDMLAFVDRDHRYLVANPAYARMYGRTPENLSGMRAEDILGPAAYGQIAEHLTAALAGESRRFMMSRLFADGSLHHLESDYWPFSLGEEIQGVVVSLHDVTRLRETQRELESYRNSLEAQVVTRTRELEKAEARLRLILDSSADGLYGVDESLRITFANPAACQMLGYRQQDLVGKPAHETLHYRHGDGRPYPPETCPMEETLRRGVSVRRGDEVFWRADGMAIPVAYACQPMHEEGRIVGAVVSFTDITTQLDAEAAREASLAEARHLVQVRSEFLANMSHEIRTPLNAVLGLAQIGLRESALEQGAKTFRQILDSGQILLGIVNDILDFSKIEAGKLTLDLATLNLGEVVDRAVTLTAHRGYGKGLSFRVVEAADLPATILGDGLRLSQILVNLLSNAFKFTESGWVELALWRRPDTLVFQVSDSGIGLRPDQIARLFSPFEQADGTTTRRFGGTGLGLSICKRLSDLMGGRIRVSSQPDQGSRFELELPLQQAGPALPLPEGVTLVLSALDDGEALSLAGILGERGARVRILDADVALRDGADLVVLGSDALAGVAEHLEAALLRGQSVAVAVGWGKVQDLGPWQGRVAVLEAPLRVRHILALLASQGGLGGVGGLGAPVPAAMAPVSSGPRLRGLRILAAEDNQVNRLVLEEMLTLEGAELVCLENGRQALERLQQEGATAYHLLLTDIQMPEMDGYETTRRARLLAPDLPVVGLTAHTMPEERQRCLAAGMVEHVAKPIDLDRLVAVILAHARAGGGHDAGQAEGGAWEDGASPATSSGVPGPGESPLDVAALMGRFRSKPDFARRLLVMVRESHGEDGQKLRDVIAARDFAALTYLAHSLKGMAGNIFAEPLRAQAEKTEKAARANQEEALQAGTVLIACLTSLLDFLEAYLQGGQESPHGELPGAP